jgi:hypothetical protein
VLGYRPSAATALAALATAIALASAWHSGGHMWRSLENSYGQYAPYTEKQREHAAIEAMGLPGDIFDYYAQYLLRGDRVYFQSRTGGLGAFIDLPTAVTYAGRFYLLPARQATSLDDATVVVSFFADPALLHVRFLTQQRAGLQPIFVSRISLP